MDRTWGKPERDKLLAFFTKALENANKQETRKIYIVEDDGMKVGYLYITPDNCVVGENRSFELAVAISEKYWRHGYARKSIALGLKKEKNGIPQNERFYS